MEVQVRNEGFGVFCSSYSADGMADDARHGGDVPATLRTARLTGRGMRERCGGGRTMHLKVVQNCENGEN